jgi:hypothetical protein
MKVTQEREQLSTRPILIGAVGFVAITALGLIMAWAVLRLSAPGAQDPAITGRGWGTAESREQVNGMRTSLFPRPDTPARADPGVAAARLREYGWVDREQQIVHVPLARAKALYLERSRRHAAASTPQHEGGAQ